MTSKRFKQVSDSVCLAALLAVSDGITAITDDVQGSRNVVLAFNPHRNLVLIRRRLSLCPFTIRSSSARLDVLILAEDLFVIGVTSNKF